MNDPGAPAIEGGDRLEVQNNLATSGANFMSTLARLEPILDGLSEDRIRQLIDFARFLATEQDRQEWSDFGQKQLAQAYGDDEPEYTAADIRPSCEP